MIVGKCTYLVRAIYRYSQPPMVTHMEKRARIIEASKVVKSCNYKGTDNSCCHANNYLRPNKCKQLCVLIIDEWARSTYPDWQEEAIRDYVLQITESSIEDAIEDAVETDKSLHQET